MTKSKTLAYVISKRETLSEWKLAKKVRVLSKYQAKRYANSLKKEG